MIPKIAEINGAVITPFMLEREVFFGLSKSYDPETILDWKIKEHLIAAELRKRNYSKQPDFIDASRAFSKEVYVEEHFQQIVSNKVTVSDEEIRQEIQKRYVKFAFRFIPFQNELQAKSYKKIWEKNGYDETLLAYLDLSEIRMLTERWQSPLIEAYDIEPALLEILQDLSINSPSEPIYFQNQWVVFEVTDIRRIPIGEWDIDNEWESAKKVVWNRKAIQAAENHVLATMEPLNVRTNRSVLEQLCNWLYPKFSTSTPTRSIPYLLSYQKGHFTDNEISTYNQIKDNVLVRWRDDSLTVSNFLDAFIPGLYPIRVNDKSSFLAQMSDAVALVVRDLTFFELTSPSTLRSDSLEIELRLREDKWLFQTYKNSLLKSIQSDSLGIIRYYQEASDKRNQVFIPFNELDQTAKTNLVRKIVADRLVAMADSLSNVTKPTLYDDTLNKCLVEIRAKLQNSNFKQVQIFKNYANRPAWPAVDMIWPLASYPD